MKTKAKTGATKSIIEGNCRGPILHLGACGTSLGTMGHLPPTPNEMRGKQIIAEAAREREESKREDVIHQQSVEVNHHPPFTGETE